MNKLHLALAATLFSTTLFTALSGLSADSAADPKADTVADRKADTAVERKDDIYDRKIVSSDIIIVEVFGEKDLSGEHRVQQSGTIKYPLLGSLEVAGKTPAEVGQLLQAKLAA